MNLDFLRSLKSKLQLRWHLHKNRKLTNREVTIISNNCIAGVIYHDCGLRFLSPTVNLWFQTEDFFTYAANILQYSPQQGAKLREIFEEGISYPLGLLTPKSADLPAIKLYFQHYPSFELAKKKWEGRSKRINFDNICLIFECSQPITGKSPIPKLFRQAPYSHKVIVTSKHSVTDTGTEVVHLPVYDLPGYQPGKLFTTRRKFSLSRWLDDFNYVEFLNRTRGKLLPAMLK
ncbi:DUF1919 domain-containing protein [Varibaculum vaginae]|uniref:DUF1919 domain-containing protein n=1 Tax=Varibaculum vaginae TaxID=2364797 RepID=UPI001357E528|nr:DUF1919 domain-containing protein [Varibaculum vaginae]